MNRQNPVRYFYSILFLAVIILPLVFTNIIPEQNSFFDNKPLPEFPEKVDLAFFRQLEDYYNLRLGFREPAISAYQMFNDRLFSLMEHPSYTRGEQNYLYFRTDNYIRDYQRIAVNTNYLKRLVAYLERLEKLAGEYGSGFTFVIIPDKKSIYPEYFPKGYNIKDTPSKLDVLLNLLSQTGLDWLSLKDAFLNRKESQQIYNVEYDAGHWNANGEFYGHSLIIEHLHQLDGQIPVLRLEDYEVSTKVMTSLQTSRFPIREEVPQYALKESKATNQRKELEQYGFISQTCSRYRYVQTDSPVNELKLLIIGDSYMSSSYNYYASCFREVTFLHVANLPQIRPILETFQPDMVILEAAERVIGGAAKQMLDNDTINMQEFPLYTGP